MSFKFFNNNPNSSLENRLKDNLSTDISNIEFLLAYFRLSGFYKIADFIKDQQNVRILIGINFDKTTFEAQQKVQQDGLLHQEVNKPHFFRILFSLF